MYNLSYIEAGSIKPNQTYAFSNMADKLLVQFLTGNVFNCFEVLLINQQRNRTSLE